MAVSAALLVAFYRSPNSPDPYRMFQQTVHCFVVPSCCMFPLGHIDWALFLRFSSCARFRFNLQSVHVPVLCRSLLSLGNSQPLHSPRVADEQIWIDLRYFLSAVPVGRHSWHSWQCLMRALAGMTPKLTWHNLTLETNWWLLKDCWRFQTTETGRLSSFWKPVSTILLSVDIFVDILVDIVDISMFHILLVYLLTHVDTCWSLPPCCRCESVPLAPQLQGVGIRETLAACFVASIQMNPNDGTHISIIFYPNIFEICLKSVFDHFWFQISPGSL